MNLTGCQVDLIDDNVHLQKFWKFLVKNQQTKSDSKNDKDIKVSPLLPITVNLQHKVV